MVLRFAGLGCSVPFPTLRQSIPPVQQPLACELCSGSYQTLYHQLQTQSSNMFPTKSGKAPPPESPAQRYTRRGQRLPSNRGDVGEQARSYEELCSSTGMRPERDSESDGTIIVSPPPQPRSRTRRDQRRQEHRRDCNTGPDLYSGAIEGCSRDHHPDYYPELQPKANPTTHHGDRFYRRSSPKIQLRSPSAYPWEVAIPWEDAAGSDGDDDAGSYENCRIPNFPRKLLHRAGAGTGPDRKGKGKELPLTPEERMGARPGRHRAELTNSPSHPARPSGLPALPSTAAERTIEGFVSYPQINGYHNPVREGSGPLFVANPDAGSEAERSRGRAIPRQVTLLRERRRRSRSEAEAERSEGGRWFAKKFRRMLRD